MLSSYAEWLRAQGEPIFEGADAYWLLNNGALTPATAGPRFLERLSTSQAGVLLKESRAWFLRYSSDPCDEATAWWHVICDGYEASNLSANTRSKLNRGTRNCHVRRLEPGWLAEHGYGCYKSAYSRYKGVRASSEDRFRRNIKKTIGGPFEYWGVFVDERLSGYCQCILEGGNVATNVIKFDPTELRHYTSYALFGGLLEHYVKGQSKTISNGTRSIAHATHIQDFLLKLGFRKQFCRLNVIYQPWLAIAARAAFPFRKVIASLPDYGVSHKLRVFLFQEELKRRCR